jgi:hypothetical protein
MANYIHNAKTPEDHEAIVAHFDVKAAETRSLVEGFDIRDCEHSQMVELQKNRSMFVGITARGHCRELLRSYVDRLHRAVPLIESDPQRARKPPSTTRPVPVTNDESSEHNHNIASATSFDCPSLPTGSIAA